MLTYRCINDRLSKQCPVLRLMIESNTPVRDDIV